MKFSQSLSILSLLAPLVAQSAFAVPSGSSNRLAARQFGNGRFGFNRFRQDNNGNNNNNNNNNDNEDNNDNNNNNNDNGNNNGNDNADPATSLTLDPSVIAQGFNNDGQDEPVDGQSPSLTSPNNFINFCVGETITDGKQIREGSCNPCPIGKIPSTQNMPSSKFAFPPNGDTSLAENEPFTIKMNIRGMQTGFFVNAQANYFAAPQQLNNQGQIIGHTHVVIERMEQGLGQTEPTDPNVFQFFKGINTPAQGGVVTADVTDGLPAGDYRCCSINTASNHQPLIVPVAQHGGLDDCVYFTVGGQNNNGNDNGDNNDEEDAAEDDEAADNNGGNNNGGNNNNDGGNNNNDGGNNNNDGGNNNNDGGNNNNDGGNRFGGNRFGGNRFNRFNRFGNNNRRFARFVREH